MHPRVAKLMDNRRKMTAGALPIDWGYAENLAYGSLLTEGKNVRLTGQDVGRGTFFHRHVTLNNQLNGETYIPLQNLSDKKAKFYIYNSLLSEEGVLGLNTVTAVRNRILWLFGKLNSGISPTALKW